MRETRDADLADAIGRLGGYPELGRPGLISGTRELFPIHSYRIVNEISSDAAQILAIVHTSRTPNASPGASLPKTISDRATHSTGSEFV